MSVGRDEVDRIAGLAKLSLESHEAERLVRDMNRILDHVERLQAEPAAEGAAGDAADDTPTAVAGDASTAAAAEPSDAVAGDASTAAASTLEADAATDLADAPGSPISGTRDPRVETPDPLRREPTSFAPRMEDGFFVVPPPPGVVAEAGEPSDSDEP